MVEKICLVTGATSGIGAVTAEALARQGSTVVLVGRNEARCQATVQRIQEKTSNANVAHLRADLASQADIRRLADRFRERYPALHVLVNNAGGIFVPRRRVSPDGIEMTFALNHLGYFLLTNLLLETIKASAPARIVNVSSIGHTLTAGIDFDDPQFQKRWYRGFPAYFQSKLANLLFSYELARRLEGTGVTVNALHPGMVRTNIGRNNLLWRLLEPLVTRLSRIEQVSPEEGAETIIYLASSPEVEGRTGGYYVEKQAVPSSEASYDQEAARRLWDLSARMTGLA